MGKASKWFRGLLGLSKPDSPSSTAAPPPSKPPKEKRRWSFVKSYRENNKDHHHQHHHASSPPSGPVEGPAVPDKHAAAVAAATTAVGEVAVASAHVTAAVATLRSSGRSAIVVREEWAAIKIQAAFRGCLARRALRALKGLVKLQALVRGHIERKRTAEWLQRLQALLQANARVRAGRAQILQSAKFSTGHLHGPTTPDKFESSIRSVSMKCDQSSSVLKRNSSKSRFQIGNPAKCENRSDIGADERSSWNQRRSWTRACSMDNKRSVMILGIDSQKPHMGSKRRNLFYSSSQPLVSDHYSHSFTTTKDSTSFQSGQSPSSGEVQSYNSPLKINEVVDSPQILSASSKDRSPFTPTKSDDSRSYLSSYSDYPNYMAYTESSKAKVRSLSAPKLRPQYETSTSFNRHSLHGFGESRLATQRVSALRASFTSKAYPGSGHLDNLGLPVGYRY